MIGTVGLKGLEIICVIGAFDEERVRRQPLRLNIAMTCDFAPATADDRLSGAVNYAEVVGLLTDLAESGRFHLIETFAEKAVAALMAHFATVQAIDLEVEKPQAIPAADCAFVRVRRER